MKRKNTKRKQCRKVGYKNPETARQALKDFGYARGSKRWYKCQHHDQPLYHLTSEDSPNA